MQLIPLIYFWTKVNEDMWERCSNFLDSKGYAINIFYYNLFDEQEVKDVWMFL